MTNIENKRVEEKTKIVFVLGTCLDSLYKGNGASEVDWKRLLHQEVRNTKTTYLGVKKNSTVPLTSSACTRTGAPRRGP
jgi:hypothetical protein